MSRRADAERAADQAADGVGPLDAELTDLPVRVPRDLGLGHPLSSPLRTVMEARLGHDLADVRIHADSAADRAARVEGATAFTHGRDIAFRRGAYDPTSSAGGRLLAHELSHVVQQRVAGRAAVQRQNASVDWETESRRMTDTELQAAIERLELELQAAIASSPETEEQARQLSVLNRVMAQRQSGIRAARAVTAARRAVITDLMSQADSSTAAAAVAAIDLDTSVESLFTLGFVAGCTAAVPPGEVDEFAQDLRDHAPTFYGGYLFGLPIGLGKGLWNLIEGIGTLLVLGWRMRPGALLDAAVAEAVALALSAEHRAERVRQYEQLQRLRAALVSLSEEFGNDPTVLLQWSNELGIAVGQEFGREMTTGFFRKTVFEQGQKVGDFIGQILFEVLLEIILAAATEGVGNLLRGVAAVGEGAHAGGRLVRLIRQAMEASPAVRRLIEIVAESSGAIRRGERLIEEGGEAVRTGERVVEGGGDAARTGERVVEGGGDAARTGDRASEGADLTSRPPDPETAPRPADREPVPPPRREPGPRPTEAEQPGPTPEPPAVTPEAPAVTPEAPAVTPEAPAVTPEPPVVSPEPALPTPPAVPAAPPPVVRRTRLEDVFRSDGSIADSTLDRLYADYVRRCPRKSPPRVPLAPRDWALHTNRGDAAEEFARVMGADWRTVRRGDYPGYHPELIDRPSRAPTGEGWTHREVPLDELRLRTDGAGDPYWTFPDLNEGEVLTLPSGTRVWRDPPTGGRPGIIWEEHPVSASVSGRRSITAGEETLLRGDEISARLAETQRAHGAASPGLGFDSPYSVARASREVNLAIENAGIERWVRQLRDAAPDVQYVFTTGTGTEAGALSNRLYRVAVRDGDELVELATFELRVPAGALDEPVVEVASVSEEALRRFGMPSGVDVPPGLRERLGFVTGNPRAARVAEELSGPLERSSALRESLQNLENRILRSGAPGGRTTRMVDEIAETELALQHAEAALSGASPSDPRLGRLTEAIDEIRGHIASSRQRVDINRLRAFREVLDELSIP